MMFGILQNVFQLVTIIGGDDLICVSGGESCEMMRGNDGGFDKIKKWVGL